MPDCTTQYQTLLVKENALAEAEQNVVVKQNAYDNAAGELSTAEMQRQTAQTERDQALQDYNDLLWFRNIKIRPLGQE